MRKFFRRSKKPSSDLSAAATPSSSSSWKPSLGKSNKRNSYDEMERVKYRMYNGRQQAAYYNSAVEHSSVRVPWLELPPRVLERVFTFICPHASDDTYENCESSAIEDACMLCDLRDLAHAGLVCRAWRRSAIKVM